jgi:Right handed beta helix region
VKKAILVLAVAVAGLAVGATQLQATTSKAPSKLIVGDGDHSCKNAGFDSPHAINDAITAASAGQTIKVCAGSYEAVNVTKSITLNGSSLVTTSDQCQTPTTVPATDAKNYSVIDGGVTIADGVDGVKISGFTIQNGDAGVAMNGSSEGVNLTKNVIQANTMGVYFNGGTHDNPNKVQSSCIRSNNTAGPANGNGIYSDQGLDSAQITGNTFYNNHNGNEGGAINLPDGAPDSVLISTNISNANENFVSVTGSTHVVITGNTATHSFGGAVFLDGGNVKTQITTNTFSTGDDDGIGLGGSDPNTQVLIYGNTITGNDSYGIDTSDSGLQGSLISKNTISSNATGGIALLNPADTGNFVTNNKVTSNGLSTGDNCKDADDNTFYSNNVECAPA